MPLNPDDDDSELPADDEPSESELIGGPRPLRRYGWYTWPSDLDRRKLAVTIVLLMVLLVLVVRFI